MYEKDVIGLLKNYHRYEAELGMIEECALPNSKSSPYQNERYSILKRRIAFVKHSLTYVQGDAANILRLRFLENLTWPAVGKHIDQERGLETTYDERTLQRLQSRAVKDITDFLSDRFGQTLDVLVEQE